MIERTHAMVYDNNYKFEKGGTGYAEAGGIDQNESNNRDIAYVPWVEHSHFIYETLEKCVIEANAALFQFDISYVTDPLHYVIYPTPNQPDTLGQVREIGGHLDWHMDIGQGGVNRRKLSTTVQLSDPNDYEGGDFQVWYGGSNSFITMPREKGDVLVFPAFYMHRVTPVTKGERRCLVYWTGGEPFR
jgi:PKHD-type hydroxylase